MKTERAIELLKRISDSQFDGPHGDERREALEMAVRALFSQQTVNDSQGLVNDCISRKMAIDAVVSAMIDGADAELVEGVMEQLPSAQPERLTDDDFETIRIHLNAYKEKLCNQQRWEEAEEYQRIIDRFMAFASAQPETHDKRTETHACDLISRKMAIDEVKRLHDVAWANWKETRISANTMIDALKDLPSAQPQWIPCSERLPEENDDYWVTADPRYVPPNYKSTDIVSWYEGKWLMADYFVLDGEKRKMPTYKVVEVNIPIIAWMPLPKPYGGE